MQRIKHILILFLFLPFWGWAQQTNKVTLSGTIKDSKTKTTIPFGNVQLKTSREGAFIAGTVSDGNGRFSLTDINSGNHLLAISYIGYKTKHLPVLVGSLTTFLDLGHIELEEDANNLNEIKISGQQTSGIGNKMDKKTFSVADNISQEGGSVLQVMKNLPGVSTTQDGKLELRGSDKVSILIDGKQTAITGFAGQTGLDNIPASAIEKIEIINNPSAKFDANGNAGIINIIYKKNKQDGFNGKATLTSGLGALWQKKENLPGIRPQYQNTPKINPSLSLNYRKNKINTFFQGDWLYTQTLNRNEFAERNYDTGEIIRQQVKRNRITTFATAKTGMDWNIDDYNTVTVTGLFNREKIIDRGDIPYFNHDLSVRSRLWQFLEDEVKYTASASAIYQHNFKQPGHTVNASFNYTFHREDEKYFFTNIMPAYTGEDSFKLLSDEQVADLNVDYVRPLKHGKIEGGLKFRRRTIPVNMRFFPGLNSPIDINAGGWADYRETIPAIYGNYVYENNQFELEAGLRAEYVKVDYKVNPSHNIYKSEGYDYARPFPNLRLAYKLNDQHKISIFYNRRVDRPNEVDIRIFPKYDEPEVIKVGNPALRPQFTSSLELGYKINWSKGYFYTAFYHRITDGTITRIATQAPGSTLIYNVFQNAGRSYNSGIELIVKQDLAGWISVNANANVYQNTINAFQIENKYPVPVIYTSDREQLISGNFKINSMFHLSNGFEAQLTGIYLAPDLIPQGRVSARYSVDLGIKKTIQKGSGELFLNATDILNTLNIQRDITGNGFRLRSTDYYETQVLRAGYSYKF
ncbi:outer membrane receptor protein involved in Fe transport [Pedobacter cryoconitis]|uniref:TonB-dependent receptor domain-containing protein n=1 Tax=Pedobacter cryoconitis TaxID=188932 RepID=UPI00161E99A0|nr:outer membrane beta-barrel family protein [Pedobacter cryoconitis]MBB6270964.1 outer membrane receptor protein involved in Fe transport [Pedobacter cryoconitis]